jgi:CRISPR-associated protein Csb2
MNRVQIRVSWPDGTYHGREWPPAPLRLYQAMLAGYRTGREPDPRLDAALMHLETLAPPVIHAPPAVEQAPVAAAVPNNDGDVTFGHWAKGAMEKARKSEAALRTIRMRRPWRFDGPVTYTWSADPQTAEHLPALAQLAGSLTALGQGTDLAWAAASPGGFVEQGLNYRPAPSGERWLTIPYPGVFDALERRHQALRHRIRGAAVHGVPEPDHAQTQYCSDLDPPGHHWSLFSLHDPATESPWSVEGPRLLDVAAMTRHAIHRAAQRAGLDAETIAALMGHGEAERILIHPLPNVGHVYADGRIRRVLLCAPETLDPRVWRAVVYRLTGADLTPPGVSEPVAVLMPAPRDDKLIDRYTDQSTTWTTATPVVLPGHDHRRGKSRPQRSLARLLRHAGIPEALVEEATFEPAPRLRGSPRARDCRLPAHLAGRPTAHISVRWKIPIPGPIALGAGVGYGFGVFSAC